MEPIQTITVIIFVVTIFLVIVRWIDSVVAALLGVIAMIIAGTMTETEAPRDRVGGTACAVRFNGNREAT